MFNFYGHTICDTLRSGQPIHGNTSSPDTINAALGWIHDCVTNHPACSDSSTGMLPKRVLDVSSFPIRLYETNKKQGTHVCLSHCWGPEGKSKVLRTTKAEFSAFTQEIPWSRIPQTFHDAIQFVRSLQVKYLWIDSLCIIQDDVQDWERQAGLMADFYANCLVSIAASSAPNADGGLFTKPEDLSPSIQVAQGTVGGCSFPIYAQPWINHCIYEDCNFPLHKRGWVLQEILLAPRTIHFNVTEIVWECREAVRCECGQDRFGHPNDPSPKTLIKAIKLEPDDPNRYQGGAT